MADLGAAGEAEAAVAQAVEWHGRLDVAFNNAGTNQEPHPLEEVPVEEFDRLYQVNLRGLWLSMVDGGLGA